MKLGKVIDVTKKISQDMTVWPGDPDVHIARCCSIDDGDDFNLSNISMGLHTGTHVDAPLHFINGGRDVSSVDPGNFLRFVKVFSVNVAKCITREDLKDLPINEGDALFFRTSNSDLPENGAFNQNYVYLDISAAEYLLEKKVEVVGIDYFSIDGYEVEDYPVHKLFLSKGVIIVEGLYLKDVAEGVYLCSFLPLKINGADGSPVRAVLMEINPEVK
ncbi:MAG TPA: cyclase family protein [Clostridiaceae bacterium]|nr:cyclase family protein [Clostridiaceae bacterium]